MRPGRTRTGWPRALAVVGAGALLLAAPVTGATRNVPADYPTVHAALVVAAPGDTVALACGTYHEAVLQIPSGIVLRSESGDPTCVTVDGGGGGTVLFGWGVSAETRIEGLTITGGNPSNHGGGLYFSDSDVRISRCVFVDNETANWGGGIAFQGTSSPVIEDCEFTGNRSLYGGGIYCEAGSPIVRRCGFRGNAARFSGGGLVAWGGGSHALVEDCLFAGNEGTFLHGGALLATGADLQLIRCTLAGNYAEDHGSGVFARVGAEVKLKQCIVVFGTGSEALACGATATLDVACCDVYGNDEGDFTGCVADQATGHGNFSEDPLFCGADAGDYTLRADSPCLPSGPSGCDLVGALGEACGSVGVEALGWGAIKAKYR